MVVLVTTGVDAAALDQLRPVAHRQTSAHSLAATPWDARSSNNPSTEALNNPGIDGTAPDKHQLEWSALGLPPFGVLRNPNLPAANRDGSRPSTGASARSSDQTVEMRSVRPASSEAPLSTVREQMRPKINIAGQRSFQGEATKNPPIKAPGTSKTAPVKPAMKKTYKSLSPYGILFEE